MGWRQLQAWLLELEREVSGEKPDPNRWTPASRSNFAEMDEKRRRLRGR